MSADEPGRRSSRVAPLILALVLVAATWPVWRVLLLGDAPTIDELSALRCIGRR